MEQDLNYIKPKNSLRQKEKKTKIKRLIKSRITSIENYQNLKYDEELTLLICNFVENLVKKKYGIDKKLFVIEILTELFGLSLPEQEIASNHIQFLFDNLLIHVVPVTQKATHLIWGWIKRKIG